MEFGAIKVARVRHKALAGLRAGIGAARAQVTRGRRTRGCLILFIITDDDPRPGPVAISPAIIAILFIVAAFITLVVTDFTVQWILTNGSDSRADFSL